MTLLKCHLSFVEWDECMPKMVIVKTAHQKRGILETVKDF